MVKKAQYAGNTFLIMRDRYEDLKHTKERNEVMNKAFLVIMGIVIAVLLVLDISISGVGAMTPQTPQQMMTILNKDVTAVQKHENTKTCHKLESDAWKFQHNYYPTNDIVRTIWVEMTSKFNLVGDTECNNSSYDYLQKQDIKWAKYREHQLDVRFAKGQGVQVYAK